MQQSSLHRRADKGGFTLVELLMVMMMVILLSAAALNGIIRSQRTFTFNGTDQQVGAMVREARSLAVTGKAILDYTDYDQDMLDDSDNDYVTPAHYGVHFDPATGIMTLFADLHGSGTEGEYDAPTGGFQVFNMGEDLKIAEYTLPSTLDLLVEGSGGAAVDTIMFSPLFADTTFYDSASMMDVDLTGEFFVFGIRENDQASPFERCLAIHPIAGVAETTDATGTACP